MEDTILGVPKVAVYFVLAIVLPIIVILILTQGATFTSISQLAREQQNTNSLVNRLLVTPTAAVTPSPTVFLVPTQPAGRQGVNPATRSGQVR